MSTQQQIAQKIFSNAPEKIYLEPYPYFKKLMGDMFQIPNSDYWVATRYQDVDGILKSKNFGSNFWKNKIKYYGLDALKQPCFKILSQMLFMKNQPQHTQLRAILQPFFNRNKIKMLTKDITEICINNLNFQNKKSHFDILNNFSYPFAKSSLAILLGFLEEDHNQILELSTSVSRLFNPPVPMTHLEIQHENEKFIKLQNYIENVIAKKQFKPNGILNALINNHVPKHTCIGQISQLILAAHDTTPHAICNTLFFLMKNQKIFLMLKAHIEKNNEISQSLLNELLRFDPPIQMVNREALEDTQIRSAHVQKGEKVILLLATANRDPLQFKNPDNINIKAQKNRILSFGAGYHHCLGAHLAQLQTQIALQKFIQTLPDSNSQYELKTQWKPSLSFRGMEKFEIYFK